MTIHAVGFVLLGALFFWVPGPVMALFMSSEISRAADARMTAFAGMSFLRMWGIVLFGMGLTLSVLRRVAEADVRRALASALFVSSALGLVISSVQQYAIWNTLAGMILVGFLAALALGYAYFVFVKQSLKPVRHEFISIQAITTFVFRYA